MKRIFFTCTILITFIALVGPVLGDSSWSISGGNAQLAQIPQNKVQPGVLMLLLDDEADPGPPPPAGSSPVLDTGQTKCYDNEKEIQCPWPGEPFYGQDAQYPGVARSYTRLMEDGEPWDERIHHPDQWIMTRDNVTGLIWELKTDEKGLQYKNNTYTWYDFDPSLKNTAIGIPDGGDCLGSDCDTYHYIQALNDSEFGGIDDWRMPNVKELSSLVNSGKDYPALDDAWFPNTKASRYWCSDASAGHPDMAWTVSFSLATTGHSFISENETLYVHAVRLGQSEFLDDLQDNDDGTVTDPNTGLMWQKETAPEKYTWQEALEYAEELELNDYSDWRLPNRNELQSLVDYKKFGSAVDEILDDFTECDWYWSSTTNVTSNNRAWSINFTGGWIGERGKSQELFVRAVRTVQD